MPAKQAHYIETDNPALHFLLIPNGEMELGYQLFGITQWEAEDAIEEHGSAQKWLGAICYSKELRGKFMSNGFHRTSENGRFGSFDSDSRQISRSQVLPKHILVFEGQFQPGTMVEIHRYPEVRPTGIDRGFLSMWVAPPKPRPVPSGRSARLRPPDFEEVTVDQNGDVKSPNGRTYKWAPLADLDSTRLTILADLHPIRICLIRCVDPSDRYIAFQFRNGVTILTCPVIKRSAYYKLDGDLRLEDLVGVMRSKVLSRGFKTIQHFIGWRSRFEQIVLRGKIIAPRANRPDLPSEISVRVDRQGRVVIPNQGHFKWAPRARLDRERLKVLRALGPNNVYLVRCIDEDHRYLAFVFRSVIVFSCPVIRRATYWVARGRLRAADLPRKFSTREEAVKNGARLFRHDGNQWPNELRDIVMNGNHR